MGMVISILERPRTNLAPAKEQRMTYLAPITILAFQERNMVRNNWSFFVLVCWLFMAFILMQSFTANLSAILTVDQLKFAFSDDQYIGYHEASFMKKFLIETLGINESRLRGYASAEGFHDAMSRGSKNGGIDAIFDEIPYMKLLVNRYYPQYKMLPPTYRTDGLGFAFPMGSPLASNFSRAILNVTQGPGMTSIEKKNFGPGYSSEDPLSNALTQGTSSLTFHEFAGLFIIVGSLTALAVICAETAILSKLSNIIRRFIHKFFFKNNSGEIKVDEDMTDGEDDDNGAPPVGLGEDRGEQRDGEQESRGEEIVETTFNIEDNDVRDVGGETNNCLQRNF
ncbi:hypothetical protein CDL12_12630 [Handroanthus impetiginosus]|uniref:Ionotropic glutamate receptor C-terminal domain-containing protein n=1 Tax=Handroanthus impetiginosus TaxID=429701 RepID=A0A2G9HB19_9LAMI|nr:hypothetical protein CDL12_12630 [Handroanthus impetiginosus]